MSCWSLEATEITILRDAGQVELTCRKASIFADGDHSEVRPRRLPAACWAEFQHIVEAVMFWKTPIATSAGLDGEAWFLAAYRKGEFRNVYRWCGGTLSKPGEFLAELAEVDLREPPTK